LLDRTECQVDTKKLDHFLGSVMGTFAGDALGKSVEGWSRSAIQNAFGFIDLKNFGFRRENVILWWYQSYVGQFITKRTEPAGMKGSCHEHGIGRRPSTLGVLSGLCR
jgi:hypothetical protein